MKQRCRKNLKISNVIMSMLTHELAHILKREIKFSRNTTYFHFTVAPNRLTEQELKDLLEILNLPRQIEMEEYYWSLLGESKNDDNLMVVARMVDEVSAKIEDDVLTLDVVRKNA